MSVESYNQQKGKCGCEIIYTKKKGNHIDLMNLMQCLGNMQIDSLLLEGGSAMNWSALEQQIVDEVQIYIAPKIFGGSAKSPVSGQGVAFPNDAIM
ncbi:RibD family protein, partial [Erysipelatoclostridium ramosum]|uniref:RibD family protein n=1 Tax=Thomasclavelia ramosa TaxID=1547 RepID=UPI001D086C4D